MKHSLPKMLLVAGTIGVAMMAQESKVMPESKAATSHEASSIPLTNEERLSLMTLNRDAFMADRDLKAAVLAYQDAEKRAQTAVKAYQDAVQVATKKAGCELDQDFKCSVKK